MSHVSLGGASVLRRPREGEPTALPLDIAFGHLAGTALALAARGPLARTHDPARTRYFAVSVIYGTVALGPIGLALYAMFPDWTLMYVADPSRLPGWLMVPLVFLAHAASPPIGFLTAHRFLARERKRARRLCVLGPIAGALLVAFLARRRLAAVAYYEAYFADLGERLSLLQSKLLPVAALGALAAGATLAYAIVAIRRHVERVETVATDPSGEGAFDVAGAIEPGAPRVAEERAAK